jgi:hypothetical protein
MQGKKKNNVIQNGTALVFFFKKKEMNVGITQK